MPGTRRLRWPLILWRMDNVEVLDFAGPEELARAAASQWLKEMELLRRRTGPCCVALSGGRIAGRFFSVAAALLKQAGAVLDWPHFFWSDERCVPPEDSESNFRLANETLLKPLAVPGTQIHRVRGEDPPEVAASEAEAELRRIVPVRQDGTPGLDVVFLGLGEEGHVASLFPGEPEEAMSSNAVFRAVVARKPPPHRITLGYRTIAAASQVWVLASGSGKELALRQSLTPGGSTPLARVLRLRQKTIIFTDIPPE